MASSRANVNDIFASFLPVCDIGEGQAATDLIALAQLRIRRSRSQLRIRILHASFHSHEHVLRIVESRCTILHNRERSPESPWQTLTT
jgi:hypothetical protein